MGLIGAHVSIAGGVENAPNRGSMIKANSIQIFTANQNQWFPKEPAKENYLNFKESLNIETPKLTVSHASYLLNMGSPDEKKLNMSRSAFLKELDRCDNLGIDYVVFHPGSHMKTDEMACLKRISESLNYCLENRPELNVNILIENTAGQGTNVGYKFDHLKIILDNISKNKKVGVCFDTQHGFASGFDLRTENGWNSTFEEFDKKIGLNYLKVFHVNDSKKECGSRVDRHASIGKGFLEMETFWCLVNDDRFSSLPMILETPDPSIYEYEIKLLEQLKGSKKP